MRVISLSDFLTRLCAAACLVGLLSPTSWGQDYYTPLVLTQDQTFDVPTTGTNYYGAISGPGGIVKIGAGTLGLRSSTGNSYSGGTTITQGVLEARGDGYLGDVASTITLNGGTLRIAAYPASGLLATLSHPIYLSGSSSSLQARLATVTVSSPIDGTGSLNLTYDASWAATPNRLTFTGNNTYNGGTTLSHITASLTGSARLGTGPILLQQGAVFSPASVANFAPSQKVTLQNDCVFVLNDRTMNPATVIQSSAPNTAVQTVLALAHNSFAQPLDMATLGNGSIYLGSAGDFAEYTGVLQPGILNTYRLGGGSNYDLHLPGPLLSLAGGANQLTGTASVLIGTSYAGDDVVSNVTIRINSANNYTGGTTLNSGTLELGTSQGIGSGRLTFKGGTLATSATPLVITNPITILGGRISNSQPVTFPQPVDLGGQSPLLYGGGAPITFSNQIANGTLRLSGGKFVLSGTNTCNFSISDYAVAEVGSDAALGPFNVPLTLGYNAALKIRNSLSITRPIQMLDSNYGGVFDTNGYDLALYGSITGGPTTKIGAGTLYMYGPAVSGGTFTVKKGDVVKGANSDWSNAYISVVNGARFVGSGSVGVISASNGSKIASGNPIGILSLASCVLSGFSTLEMEIGGKTVGTQYDQLDVKSEMIISSNNPGNLSIALANGFIPAVGDVFKIVNANSVSGSFGYVSLPILPAGRTFKVNYEAKAVTLTVEATSTYADWVRSHFTLSQQADTSISGASEDSDSDGLNNGLERFYGTDPTNGRSRASCQTGIVSITGTRYATLTFPRPRDSPTTPTQSRAMRIWTAPGARLHLQKLPASRRAMSISSLCKARPRSLGSTGRSTDYACLRFNRNRDFPALSSCH